MSLAGEVAACLTRVADVRGPSSSPAQNLRYLTSSAQPEDSSSIPRLHIPCKVPPRAIDNDTAHHAAARLAGPHLLPRSPALLWAPPAGSPASSGRTSHQIDRLTCGRRSFSCQCISGELREGKEGDQSREERANGQWMGRRKIMIW